MEKNLPFSPAPPGVRYNQVISDLCRRVIFHPLTNKGWSQASATFVVFVSTGLLHAIPTAMVHATPLEIVCQGLFFLIHWGVCALESAIAPHSRSPLRTFLLFALIYPVFGLSGIYSMCRVSVGFTIVMPKWMWLMLKAHVKSLRVSF